MQIAPKKVGHKNHKNLLLRIKMGKEILSFGNIET